LFFESEEFDAWLSALTDARGKARILARLRSATLGNLGDCDSVGEGVLEMRIHVGTGYRVYFTRRERTVYLLLSAGDKSTQAKDIARAKTMARATRESER
jgi:putative addiction module killer protein